MKFSCLTLVMLYFCSTLSAQVFVKSDASGANNGSSWNDAYTSLSDAIESADPDSEIWVASGLYKAGQSGDDPANTYFTIEKSLTLLGGFEGNETDPADRNISANPTVLSADLNGDDTPNDFTNNRGDNGYHVMWLLPAAEGTVVDGFIIEGGQAKVGNLPMDADANEWSAGGILSESSCVVSNCILRFNAASIGSSFLSTMGDNVSIQGCKIENNYSYFGCFAMEGHETAEIIDCDFENNTSEEFGGAATVGNTNVNVLNSNFINNVSLEQGGGGLFVFQNNDSEITAPVVIVEGCTFSGNESPRAGGMLMNNFADDSQITIEDCTFENNAATGMDAKAGGLGLRNQTGGSGASNLTASIIDCDFIGNTSAVDAGGAFFWSADFNLVLEMQGCEFSENKAENKGGGLELNTYNNGRLFATIDQTTFSKNEAEISGSGVSVISNNSTFQLHSTFTDCSFEENTTPGLGAGLSSDSGASGSVPGPIVSINNSDFIDNSAEAGCAGIWSSHTVLTVSDSYFEGNATLGDLAGGGAIGLMSNQESLIERSTFKENSSGEYGGAIYESNGARMLVLDNVILKENQGENALYFEDSLMLRNVTFAWNEASLFAGGDAAVLQVQNSIFADSDDNFDSDDDVEIISLGGNVSNDNSLASLLDSPNGYEDQHGMSPMLDADLKPMMGSPCVDRGNPEGIDEDALDAAGEIRIQGMGIDVGAYESDFEITSTDEELLAASVTAYPNPFTSQLNIQSEEEPELLRLFDMNGKLVSTYVPNGNLISIDDNLASGQYVVEVIFEKGTSLMKVTKE